MCQQIFCNRHYAIIIDVKYIEANNTKEILKVISQKTKTDKKTKHQYTKQTWQTNNLATYSPLKPGLLRVAHEGKTDTAVQVALVVCSWRTKPMDKSNSVVHIREKEDRIEVTTVGTHLASYFVQSINSWWFPWNFLKGWIQLQHFELFV